MKTNEVRIFAQIHHATGQPTGKWHYRVVARNGEPIGTSQAYASKWNAKRAARSQHPDLPITVEPS